MRAASRPAPRPWAAIWAATAAASTARCSISNTSASELIKFNLFDNNGTYQDYVPGSKGVPGPAVKNWDADAAAGQRRPAYAAVGGDGEQLCKGELIRYRNVDGICNDIKNPLHGFDRHALRAQRRVRHHLPRSRAKPSSPAIATATASRC